MEQEEVTISLNNIDNREVVEVFGRQITLNSILSKLENEISNTNIEEVRFIAGTIFKINASLENEVWHGRNIVVNAKEIIVCEPVHWNVSGKNSCHKYERNAGTEEDGSGLNGKDGTAGESGGNVMIVAKKIQFSENLSISANGGNGSNGQDGGNGEPGKDGKGISKTDLNSKFPPPCRVSMYVTHIRQTLNSLADINGNVRIQWAKICMLFYWDTFTSDVLKVIRTGNSIDMYDVFYDCTNEDGSELTYSYQSGVGIDNAQSFLLVRGSKGTPGKSGGEYGLGGEGGKPGEISVVCLEGNHLVDVKMVAKSGADGVNGKGGVHGRHGKRGWDMGYLDYALGRIFGDWPKYYGTDENSSLKIDYYSCSKDDRVHCPYERDSGYPYAGITVSKIENKNITTLEERNNGRSNKEREHHAKAVGKKTISRQRILKKYTAFMNTIEAEIQEEQAKKKRAYEAQLAAQQAAEIEKQIAEAEKIRTKEEQLVAQQAAEIEKDKQIAEAEKIRANEEQLVAQQAAEIEKDKQIAEAAKIRANEEQLAAQQADEIEIEQSAETMVENVPSSEYNSEEVDLAIFSTKRHVPFQPGSEHEHGKVKIIVSSLGKNNNDNTFAMKNDHLDLDEWIQLNTFVIDFITLKQLMNRFNTDKSHLDNTEENIAKIQVIQQMFLEKYKLSTLHALTTVPEKHQEAIQRNTIEIQNINNYLMETTEKNNTIIHGKLGTMKQCIFECTQDIKDHIATFVEQEMMIDNLAFNRAAKTFVLETEYADLLNECLENIQKALKKPHNENIRRFWDGFNDRPLENEVKEMIENDNTLKILYDRWNGVKRRVLQYESDEQSVDADRKIKFIEYIRSKGALSKSCRELLAYVYDVNLKVYDRDEDGELTLCEDHNPSSDTKNFILSRGNEFVQLTVNKEYLQLVKERLQKDKMYTKILCVMNTLQSIEEINNYFDKKVVPPEYNLVRVEDNHFDEKSAPEAIASYFPVGEREELLPMLEKLEYEYSKQKAILQHMQRRFSYEGKHIFFNEMCFFINAVLDNFADADQELYTYAWIVAAYSQRYWLDEVILLQLEKHFKKQLNEKQQWREYLGKINNKEVMLVFAFELQSALQNSECSVECVDEIFRLLSIVPIESMRFDGIPLSEWCYFLKEHYWMDKLRHLLEWSKDESLEDATYYIRSVENILGDRKANELLDNIKCKENGVSEEMLIGILLNLHKQKWKLSEEDICNLERSSLQEWTTKMEEIYKPILEELNIEQLTEIIGNDQISSDEIIMHLPWIRTSIQKISNKMISHNHNPVALFTEDGIKMWVAEFREKISNHTLEYNLQTYEEMLAVIDRAIEIKKGFRLRDTQRLSVLILLANERSTLAQVSTGEGKSLIVVALSLVKGLLRERVDIVTSSPVLARRDSEVNKDIYEMFDINVSHNCSDDIEDRKEAYSNHQVVYGDLANFQRDYLLDRFYGKNILGDRDFTNVIVDEVDSMLLDKGNNMLYLSHDIPGMDKLESVYIFIWEMVNSHTERPEDIDTDMVKKEILSNLCYSISSDDLMQLDTDLSFRKMNIIWNCLLDAGIVNEEGYIITDTIDSTKLDEILTPEVVQYKHRLSFLLKECVNREKYIKVPNYLKKFVERHLSSWITSAINALLMEPGQSYVVDYKKSGSKADRNANIIILDRDTGADQGCSQWDEALHQFLQLKHGCKLSLQSLKAVFVSNVTYFKMYKLLYGLTGTLGSQRERNLLKDIHQVAFVTIPTAKTKQFEEYKPIISGGYKMWLKNIKTETNKLINEEKRSVLIICDTINDADCIHNALKETFANQIHTYTRDYREFDIVQGSKQLEQGQIIIATNLAGRGTDIRITDALKQSGGLHVMLTYLPENIRIEEQAFGRAARCGDKGSGQLIIMVSSQRQYRRSKMIKLKKKRDENELYRISGIKTYYDKTIKAEEICFEEFKQVYEKHRKSLDAANISSEIKTILLQNCLDQWSFWLDEYTEIMKGNERHILQLLQKFVTKLSNFDTGECVDNTSKTMPLNSIRWKVWVDGNPMRMVELANYLSKTCVKKSWLQKVENVTKTVTNQFIDNKFNIDNEVDGAYETAMSLYDEVIKKEPLFSEAAYYYRAYILMITIKWEDKTQSEENEQKVRDVKKDLREAERLFEDHMAFALQAAGIVNELKGNNVWHLEYKAQKDTMFQLYQTFIRSIHDIFGHAVTPNTFVTDEITENVAEHIFMQLIEKGIISRPKVRKTISEQQLHIIRNDYGISVDALKQFLLKKAGPIDEELFIEECKKSFPLPSREQFWKLLIDQNVLNCIKKYAIVDNAELEAVDPSLKDALDERVTDKTLIKESIEPAIGQIVLYHEELFYRSMENSNSETINNSVAIFEKENFISLIGTEKFVMLVKKGIIRCNEMANIDKNMIASCKFSSFDSISVEDIVLKANIVKVEAELIIEELINREVLERKDDIFILKNGFHSLEDELLPSFPVYETTIRGLLSSCFAYRLALIDITEQLETDKQALRMIPKSNIYPEFFQNLIHQNIIRPPMLSKVKKENLQEILNGIFDPNKCYTNVEHWFTKLLHISTEDSKRLFKDLFVIPSDTIEGANIIDIKTNLLERRSTNRLNFVPVNQAIELLRYDMGKTIEKFYLDLKQFFEKGTATFVDTKLEQMKPASIGLQISNVNIKSIQKAGKIIENSFGTIEEEQLFSLNGLQHQWQVVDKKAWSNAILVSCIGAVQIAVGAIIILKSYALLANAGLGLIAEGINDILYATRTSKSGHFSWKDFGKDKFKSVMLTAAFSKTLAFISSGIKISGFASKILGFMQYGSKIAKLKRSAKIINTWSYQISGFASKIRSLMQYGSKIANFNRSAKIINTLSYQISGLASKILGLFHARYMQYGSKIVKFNRSAKIINTLSNVTFNQTVRRIFITTELNKTEQRMTQDMVGVKANQFEDDYIKAIFESIAGDMSRQIMSKFDDHKVFQNLKIIYDELGEHQARKLIHPLPDFASIDWDTCTSVTKQITATLTKSIASAMGKAKNKTEMVKNLSDISTEFLSNHCTKEIEELTSVIETFLDSLDSQIKEKFEAMNRSTSLREHFQPNVKNFEQFRAEVIKEWKMQLNNHVETIMLTHLAELLFNDALFRVKQPNKRLLRKDNQSRLKRKMKTLKKKYDEAVDDINMSEETYDRLKQSYHENLMKIMSKTKSPSLFAAIIRENVPMDFICAAACTSVVYTILKKMGIYVDGIVVTVQGENGIEETFYSGAIKGENVREVTLQLRDNHFIFSENQLDVPDNNCFYAALSDAITELKSIDAQDFRDRIADTIETDPQVQHLIRQGWHRYPIKKFNAVGGRAPKKIDSELNKNDKKDKEKSDGKKDKKNKRSERSTTPETPFEDTYLSNVAIEYEEYRNEYEPPGNCPNARSPNLHLFLRVTFYAVGFAGLLQAVGTKYNHTLEQMFTSGASNSFDKLKVVRGGYVHRSHKVRGIVDPFAPVNEKLNKKIKKKTDGTNKERVEKLDPLHPKALTIIKGYAGSREHVLKEANSYDKIGGWIDNMNFDLIDSFFHTYDFSKDPTDQDISELKKMVEDLVDKIIRYLQSNMQRYDETMIAEIGKVINRLLDLDCRELFLYGKFIFRLITDYISKNHFN